MSRHASFTLIDLLGPAMGRALEVLDDALWDGGTDTDADLPCRPEGLGAPPFVPPRPAPSRGLGAASAPPAAR